MAPVRTDRGFDRIVNFGDAVVAISITLLVLPLVDLHGQSPDAGVGDLLRHHGFEVVAFFLSFVVIGQLWLAHHRIFERAGSYDDVLLGLHLLWLLSIAFLPFPTALLGTSDNGRGETVLYIGALLASSLCLAALRWHLERTPALRAAGSDDDEGLIWSTPILFAVALVLAAVVPGLGAWSLLAMLLGRPIGRLRRWRRTTHPIG